MSIKIKTGVMSVNDSGTMKDIGMIVADVDSVKDAAIEKIMDELPTDYTGLVKEQSRLSESIGNISNTMVKSVNGKSPDENGNVSTDKQWKHARFDITSKEEEVYKFIINNSDNISEIVVIGKFLFEEYDGIGIIYNQIKSFFANVINVSTENCYVSIKISKTANDMWMGVCSASKWSSRDTYFREQLAPYSSIDCNGNFSIGSFWNNKKMLVGTYADVWWR